MAPTQEYGEIELCPSSTGTRSDHVVIFLPTTAQRIIRIPAFPGFGIESCQHSAAKTSSLLRITNSLPAPRQPYPGAWQKPHPAKWIAAPGHPACREINMFNNVPPYSAFAFAILVKTKYFTGNMYLLTGQFVTKSCFGSAAKTAYSIRHGNRYSSFIFGGSLPRIRSRMAARIQVV